MSIRVVETPLLSAAGITRFRRFTMQTRGEKVERRRRPNHQWTRIHTNGL